MRSNHGWTYLDAAVETMLNLGVDFKGLFIYVFIYFGYLFVFFFIHNAVVSCKGRSWGGIRTTTKIKAILKVRS